MTAEVIKQLLDAGRSEVVEFIECAGKLDDAVFETVIAFSNRFGGHLILGVDDKGIIIGVNPDIIDQIMLNFATCLDNPEKVLPTVFLKLEQFVLDGKCLLYAYVPVSENMMLTSCRIFERVGATNEDVTTLPARITQICARKSRFSSEAEIFPYITESELRMDLVLRAKAMALAKYPDHPWKNMRPWDIFRHAGLYGHDWRSNKVGFNLAAVLLFGHDEVIASCARGHITDALLRVHNIDRYDDRITVGTNLIEAYDILIEFVRKHTMDRFVLVNDQSVSVRSHIAREIVSNMLVHREYSQSFVSRLVIEKDRMYTENWNIPKRKGRINPCNMLCNPKNPIISQFFRNIGRADAMGSGVLNLYKYTELYTGLEPEIIEDDIFRTIIPMVPANRLY
ncbi:MAG: putative DNA binding domain-containing protein [Christensenellaceae bacterium]|nr:putative DNA binding domain-containing protein [Christensenellaceae bacterium]